MSRRSLAGDVGQLLRTTREMRGLSQTRLAVLTGVSQQRVSKLERGLVDARLLSGTWELRVALVPELPERVAVQLDDRHVWVPTLPWLVANDSDVADLLGRLTAVGWSRPAGSPAGA